MRKVIVALTLFISSLLMCAAAEADCPIGSFPSVDSFGNQICKGINDGTTKSIEGSAKQCPPGTRPGVDRFGNDICKSFSTGQEFHDTSKGCPIGYFESVDSYGNNVCKRI